MSLNKISAIFKIYFYRALKETQTRTLMVCEKKKRENKKEK